MREAPINLVADVKAVISRRGEPKYVTHPPNAGVEG